MFHFIDQSVSNCVCLLFAAEQVVYSGSITACLMKKLLPAAAEKGIVENKATESNS